MVTVLQAFDNLRQKLELTEAERAKASDQQNALRKNLQKHLGGISRDFLSGSYARRTAIRPLHDIDLFVVLDPTAHADVYPNGSVRPSASLRKVHRALMTAYPTADTPRLQDHSVNIVFSGTGIGYDVVPAFANRNGVWLIPDRGRDEWVQTNPDAHRAALETANTRAGGKLNPLIKMLKQWRAAQGLSLRSFHLEVMSYSAFPRAPESFPEGVRALFAHLATAVLSVCNDPAGFGQIDAGMPQDARSKARTVLLAAELEARKALQLDGAGQTQAAHDRWEALFGHPYASSSLS